MLDRLLEKVLDDPSLNERERLLFVLASSVGLHDAVELVKRGVQPRREVRPGDRSVRGIQVTLPGHVPVHEDGGVVPARAGNPSGDDERAHPHRERRAGYPVARTGARCNRPRQHLRQS